MRIRTTQYSFTNGQLGPDLNFRSDIELYLRGASEVTNMFVMPQGGVTKRKGFQAIATVDGATRIEKFAFSDTQEYVLAFYNSNVKIFRNDTLVATVSSPYTNDQITDFDYSQKFDALFFVHPDVAPYQLTRNGSDSSWTFAAISFESIPFDRFNVTQELTPSGTSGNITLTLNGSDDYWTSDHVGVKVKVNNGYANITSISSGLVANATVVTLFEKSSLDNSSADNTWREEAWSTAHGYPRTITQHQSRMIIGGTRDLPQSVFASVTSGFTDFDQSETDDDFSWTKEIPTEEVNSIRAIIGRIDLHIFTNTAQFVIDGSVAITATAGRLTEQNAIGISKINPLKINADLVFITDDGKSLQRMRYNADTASYETQSLTLLSQNILNSPVDIGYLANYDDTQSNMIFVVNGDGTMSCLTLDVEENLQGWSKHTTDGSFISVCTVDDSLYALIERNGTTYLEKMTEEEIYLDHFYKFTDAGTTNWGNALTLAGDTAQVVVSENDTDISTVYVQGSQVVGSSGEFTTDYTAQAAVVGLGYTATLTTLPIAFAANGQLMRGERIRKVRAEARVRKSRQFKIDGYTVDDRRIGIMTLDAPLPEIDKIIDIGIKGVGTNQTTTITSDQPLPLRVLGLTLDLAI